LAAEYDSDLHHTGATRIANDAKRRNVISSTGSLVITVTKEQLNNVFEFEKVARLLAVNMARRIKYSNPKFFKVRHELRALLLKR